METLKIPIGICVTMKYQFCLLLLLFHFNNYGQTSEMKSHDLDCGWNCPKWFRLFQFGRPKFSRRIVSGQRNHQQYWPKGIPQKKFFVPVRIDYKSWRQKGNVDSRNFNLPKAQPDAEVNLKITIDNSKPILYATSKTQYDSLAKQNVPNAVVVRVKGRWSSEKNTRPF